MRKTIKESVRGICYFARRFNQEHTLTPNQMFIKTAYSHFYKKITIEDIIKVISKDETIIKDWLFFTGEKRWTPAWGIQKIKGCGYRVFYVAKDGIEKSSVNITDKFYACAFMVIMEMEQMRILGWRQK